MSSTNNGFNLNNPSNNPNSSSNSTATNNTNTANSLVNLIGAAVSAAAAAAATSNLQSIASTVQPSSSVSITLNTSPSTPPPPIPLSSSLPSSISSSLVAPTGGATSSSIVHIASTTQLQSHNLASLSSSSSSSSTTSATVNNQSILINDNKMDTSGPMINSSTSAVFVGDVISRLYPNVNQQETALPRQWSSIHKCQTLQLSNGNLRVTYKGPGKTHKDAASVRTDYPIPAACGIYYYEVKIISKGRDGYMGIGLSKSEVQLNRLPGWDKNSYGYHGDDGHSFCCSGTGQNYGPTFTTGDVIGCCLNLIENTCFYTKNGYNLGIAFRDLPSDLYPTVGLQTPSESVEANFGQYPFEFDIHNYVKEWHLKTRHTIEKFPLKKETENNLPIILRKLISTYLVHHGYSSTAEAFAKSVGHVFEEELASIRNRQRIQKLVLNGSLGEAIDLTYQLFPGILERNSNLLFALKVRQFIEMINNSNNNELAITNSSSRASEISSTSNELKQNSLVSSKLTALSSLSSELNTTTTTMLVDCDQQSTRFHINGNNNGYSNLKYSLLNTNSNASSSANEEAMEMDSSPTHLTTVNKKNTNSNEEASCQCVNPTQAGSLLFNLDYEYSNLHKILQFGRELFQMNTTLDASDSQANSKMLRDAFSLLAYHDPWNSPLGFQLDQSQREPISALLNSAILEANNMPRIPPLEVVYGQTSECMRLMSKYGVAWCAYVNLNDYMQS